MSAQVVAPCKCKGTQKWITFSALNSERRKEVAKWKNCPVCQVGPVREAPQPTTDVHGRAHTLEIVLGPAI